MADQIFDGLREAVALAHTIPGVSLELTMVVAGQQLLVSDRCLGAQLTPCQLRAALLAAPDDTTSGCFTAMIERVEIRTGIHHVGGGLYECAAHDGRHERWFATSLCPARIITLLETCAVDDGDGELGVLLKHDEALGVCAVCVMSTADRRHHVLDELAVDLLASVLVDELIGDTPAGRR